MEIGDEAIYGLHGKCKVIGLEERTIGGNSIAFYKLEVIKSNLSRSNRQEPCIWLPMAAAQSQGLRAQMNAEQAEQAIEILSSREFYFDPNTPWNELQPKLEGCIRAEGGTGMAKVYSLLHVLKHRQIVAAPEVARLFESVSRVLMREICEVLKIAPKTLDERTRKGLKQKLLADQ